jgi:hypothetical protein
MSDIEAAARALVEASWQLNSDVRCAMEGKWEALRSALAHAARGEGERCPTCGSFKRDNACRDAWHDTPPPATGEAGTRGEVEKASGFVLAAAVAWLYAQALPPGDTARACSDAGLAGAVAAYLRALPEAREGESKTHG